MGTIADKLNYLNTTKANIKNAIIEKGVTVETTDTFRDYATRISEITDGSVEELTVTENGTYTGTEGVTYNPVNVNLPLGSKSITANGTYTASDDSLQGYSSVTVDIDDTDLYRDTTDSTYESVKTLSNCGAFPMLSLKVGIEPQQDLHGYDSPWVGGAGKNKCPEEWTVFGTNGLRSANNFDVQPETEYYYCSPAATQIYYRDADGNDVSGITNPEFVSANRTFTTPSGCYKIMLVLSNYGTTYNNDIAINYPSNITTYSPYSNICPISGWDEVNVSVCGTNVWDEEWKIDGAQFKAKNLIPVMPNTSYYFKSPLNAYSAFKYDVNGNSLGPMAVMTKDAVFTTDSKTYYIWFSLSVNDYGTTYNNDISINYPSTDTEYHAYNGQNYTIQFTDGDNPLTVYGGTLDVVSGELKVVPYYDSYNGKTLEGEWISDRDVYAVGTTPTIGAQVVNIGATPITYQLTPTQVKSLLGTTNLWADTGDVGDVRYFKKVEL